jgi:hypothetical protein
MGRYRSRDGAQTGAVASRRHGSRSCGKRSSTSRRVESLPVLQEAIYGMEGRLGLGGEDADTLCETSTNRDPPGQWLEAEGQWAEHHLAFAARVSSDG